MSYFGDDDDPGRIVLAGLDGTERLSPASVMTQVERYWDRVRAGRIVPSRVEIVPQGLEGVLSDCFVLERIASGLARFRVAGSHLTDLMGLEVRGMPLSAVFVPEARNTLGDALQAVFDDPAIVRLRLSSETGIGRSGMDGEMILLPLRSDLGDISRVLGAVRMSGRIGRAPRRLVIDGQSRRGLTGYAELPADTAAKRRPSGPGASATRPGPESRPYLRLVADNTSAE